MENSKQCTRCGVLKPLTGFYKSKQCKFGRHTRCKQCTNTYNKEYQAKKYNTYRPRVIVKENNQKYCYKCNKIKLLIEFHKSKTGAKGRTYTCKNCIIVYNKNNKDKIKKQHNKYIKQRRKKDPIFKLKQNLKNKIKNGFKAKGLSKSNRTIELLGCSYKHLRNHIQKQFTNQMNFNNYVVVWELDHIRPVKSFNLKDKKELYACFHFSNLRPLLKKDNRTKRDNYIFNTDTTQGKDIKRNKTNKRKVPVNINKRNNKSLLIGLYK